MRWIRFTAIIVLISSSLVLGQFGQPGAFLRFGSGARSLAMGGAYSVIVNNGDALLYNPAGLAKSDRWELSITHAQVFEGSRYECISFGYPITLKSGIGLAIADFGSSEFEGRDEYGTLTENFGVHELGVIAGYGQYILERKIRVGGSAKFIMNSVGNESAMGFGGADVGIITKELLRKFRFGIAVQNLGALEIAGDKLPMTVRAGMGFQAFRELYILADVDIVGGAFKPKIGAEYKLSRVFILRAGYNMSEITFGVGLALDRMVSSLARAWNPQLDYAAGVMNPVGNDFARVSLTFRGADKTPPPPPPSVSICDHLTQYQGALGKDGLVGASANVLFGYCSFIRENELSELSADPDMKDAYDYFHEAYVGKFGSNWTQSLLTVEGASDIFSQREHFMFTESKMSKAAITEDTKKLVQDVILVGGDSTRYDPRLQYDLGYVYESLGYLDSAKSIYGDLARREDLEENPVRPLSMYRLAYLLKESDPDSAIVLLDKLIRMFSWGFYDENGERVSYPLFPKYKDNMLADDALLLMGDIYAGQSGPDNLKKGLLAYLDIMMFYPDAEGHVRKAAAERAANVYGLLGMTEEETLMKSRAGSL